MFRAIHSAVRTSMSPWQSISFTQPLQSLNQLTTGLIRRSFHLLTTKNHREAIEQNLVQSSPSLLAPASNSNLVPVCGLKIMGKVHRRCRDCIMHIRDGVIYNHCTTHPRHKQRQRLKKPRNTWILTGVKQSKVRPW